MIAARKSTLLLLLVCAVWMDHSGVVLAQDETTVTALANTAADGHEPVTGLASNGDNVTTPPTEAPTKVPEVTKEPEPTSTTSTVPPTTTTPSTAAATTASVSSTTMAPSTASSMPSTSMPAGHNQVAANTTTPAPATTTAKPSSASLGAVFSVATLVFGLCLVYM